MCLFRHLLVFLLVIVSFCVLASRLADVLATDAVLNKVSAVYGDSGLNRVKKWLELVDESNSDNEWNQLNKVNTFFNRQIRYQNDLPLWGKNDYWASPVEMLGVGSGDCEGIVLEAGVAHRNMLCHQNGRMWPVALRAEQEHFHGRAQHVHCLDGIHVTSTSAFRLRQC